MFHKKKNEEKNVEGQLDKNLFFLFIIIIFIFYSSLPKSIN